MQLSYVITATDSNSATDAQTVVVTITGTDDAPVIETSEPITILDTNQQSISGTIGFEDRIGREYFIEVLSLDIQGDMNNLSNGQIFDSLSFQFADDMSVINWQFDHPDFEYLNPDQILTLTYSIKLTDDMDQSSLAAITINIEGTDQNPVITGNNINLRFVEEQNITSEWVNVGEHLLLTDIDDLGLTPNAANYAGYNLVISASDEVTDNTHVFELDLTDNVYEIVGNDLLIIGTQTVIATIIEDIDQLTIQFNQDIIIPKSTLEYVMQHILYQQYGSESSHVVNLNYSLTTNVMDEISNLQQSLDYISIDDAPEIEIEVYTRNSPLEILEGDIIWRNVFNVISLSTVETEQVFTELTLIITGFSDATDQLRIANTELPLTNGLIILDQNVAVDVELSDLNTVNLRITNLDNLNIDDVVALINSIEYKNLSEAPASGLRQFTLTNLQDSGVNLSANDMYGNSYQGENKTDMEWSSYVAVVAQNDAPQLIISNTNSQDNNFRYRVGQSALTLELGISTTDIDLELSENQYQGVEITICREPIVVTDQFGLSLDQGWIIDPNNRLWNGTSLVAELIINDGLFTLKILGNNIDADTISKLLNSFTFTTDTTTNTDQDDNFVLLFTDANSQTLNQGIGNSLGWEYRFTINVEQAQASLTELPIAQQSSEYINIETTSNAQVASESTSVQTDFTGGYESRPVSVSSVPDAVIKASNTNTVRVEQSQPQTVLTKSSVSLTSISANELIDFEYNGQAKLVIESVKVFSTSTEVVLQDYQPGRIYTARLENGDPLPEWINVNPITGLITFDREQIRDDISIHLMAHSADGGVEVLEIEVEGKENKDSSKILNIRALESQIQTELDSELDMSESFDKKLEEYANQDKNIVEKLIDTIKKLMS